MALMVLWAAHNGGYDDDTWYWGALAALAVLCVALGYRGFGRSMRTLSRPAVVALVALGAYVAWSYLSIAWADTPGWALEGSNRALLYLIVFALLLMLPWTPEAALGTLLAFALGVGVLAMVLLFRLASGDQVDQLVIGGRLAAPTGYFNASIALFMIEAVLAVTLSVRRELPGLLRGTLIAMACAALQLCVIGQSRGWLFTLPLVVVVAIALVRDRIRVAAVAVVPIIGALAPAHRLLGVFHNSSGSTLTTAASRAGHTALLIAAGALFAGTLLSWADQVIVRPTLSRVVMRRIGLVFTALALGLATVGAIAATHGHPAAFLMRQWRGFSHPPPAGALGSSHFAQVGSGRYDFWRVSLDALKANPLGGLGQDNFADYYVERRRTEEEPRWTHSLEMRLLAHTGLVGFGLFTLFLIAAVAAALPALRRGPPLTRAVAAAALIPMVVWLIHGSVDWFWEFPALTGPALGFLGMAGGMTTDPTAGSPAPQVVSGRRRFAIGAAGGLALIAAVIALGFPYLSVRLVSAANDLRNQDPSGALRDLSTAADLNPLNPDPGRIGGTIALQTGQFTEAERRFGQAISREPRGWFAWLGAGLAASALGDTARASHDFTVAASFNSSQSTIRSALVRVHTLHPLTPSDALLLLLH